MLWQPYPKLPVYVLCPIDGEGYSNTLHQNFLLPISHNLKQDECENSVKGDGSNKPTALPHVEDVFLANWLAKSLLEGIPKSPPKQHELVNQGPTGSTSPDSMDDRLQPDDDAPASLRQS